MTCWTRLRMAVATCGSTTSAGPMEHAAVSVDKPRARQSDDLRPRDSRTSRIEGPIEIGGACYSAEIISEFSSAAVSRLATHGQDPRS